MTVNTQGITGYFGVNFLYFIKTISAFIPNKLSNLRGLNYHDNKVIDTINFNCL